ncbi:DUF4097 family beta strand repeat-containing protein [Nonomuraea gerenzanensis]|uniref:DUF4097 domain-containing protein n=1 Tax=Nonomuraea gerenzanensis TaxID=93944 RepID=A0A1M4EED5_9ACTN|nr:DUF4097 family beta strand repeat-containing protein [Nonomuraea gerenzanensis]UBU08714.1 DUF4097 domain-containing protein [Nonomuraea gerenzanensis]SBO97076.1 hypothetical protein BN4615_P6592 [Nonomuraea gerenzanensis]
MTTTTHDEGIGMPAFDTSEPITAVLDTATATIRINAGERGDTVVEVRPSDPHNDADVQAARHTQVDYADGRLVVRTDKAYAGTDSDWGLSLGRLVESPADWARSLLLGPGSIDVTIDLPAGSRLDVRTTGSVICQGPLGEAALSTSYGDLQVEQAGRLRLRNTYGEIVVTRAHGHAEITNNHGGIDVGRIDGTAAVKSSHGDVRLGEVTGDLRVTSAHGDVSVGRALAGVTAKTAYAGLRIGEAASGSIVMETTGGGLDLGIRRGTAAWLDVSSKYGTVDVSLDPTDAPGETDQVVEVRAHTDYGDIAVHRS